MGLVSRSIASKKLKALEAEIERLQRLLKRDDRQDEDTQQPALN
jgi:hypothetical protein